MLDLGLPLDLAKINHSHIFETLLLQELFMAGGLGSGFIGCMVRITDRYVASWSE